MYAISAPFQNNKVCRDCNRMDWCEHSIGPFVHDLMIDFKYGIFHIQIRSTDLPMVMWWVMFCEIIPHVWDSWFTINVKLFLLYPFLHPIKSHVHCLGYIFLIVAVTMTLAAELSVFIGVCGWVKPSSWSVMCRFTAVCPLWNSPPNYDLAADSTTCLRILHSLWIGTFSGGGRFGAFLGWLVVSSGNSALQCACMPVALKGMMHRCQCEVSYR